MDRVPPDAERLGAGTDKGDFGPVTVVERPKDAVLTVTARSQWSGYSSPVMYTLTENWRSKDEKQIAALVTRFGSKPPGVKT